MEPIQLVGGAKLILKYNTLALISDKPLHIFSSAIHNGGPKQTKVIINTQVTEEYGDLHLHEDPEAFILKKYEKLGLSEKFVGMITFAMVADFALASKTEDDLAVSVIATAGCTHAESAGEKIPIQKIEGTINIMVLIDGNPTESCQAGTMITVTEAKTTALRELDVRSRYSGAEATGTITDAIVIAKTGKGPEITYGGPASKLGQMVASCTKKAVKEAVSKGKIGGYPLGRSVAQRLNERHLGIKKLSSELSKIENIRANQEEIYNVLDRIINKDTFGSLMVFSAAKLDEDFKNGLFPSDFGDRCTLGRELGKIASQTLGKDQKKSQSEQSEDNKINLSPFLKQFFISLLKEEFNKKDY